MTTTKINCVQIDPFLKLKILILVHLEIKSFSDDSSFFRLQGT